MAKKKEAAAAPKPVAPAPDEKRKRKTYELPGQIHDPPEESEPLRIFYESLLSQRPNSEMALIWMMEHGLLDEDDATRVQQIKLRRSKGGGGAAPRLPAISPAKPEMKALGKASAKPVGKGAAKTTTPVGRTASGGKGGAKGAVGRGGARCAGAKRKSKAKDDESMSESEGSNSDGDDLPLTKIKKR